MSASPTASDGGDLPLVEALESLKLGDDSKPAGSAGAAALPRQETSAVLKLKGLPYSTTEELILDFFQGYEVKKISFVYEPDGRPSGLAFAEFGTKEEALKALSKNGEYIGERYVRLLHVPKSEMEEQVRLGTLAIPGAAAKLRSRMMRAQQRNNMTYVATGPAVQLMPTVLGPGGPTARPMAVLGPNMTAPYTSVGSAQPVEARWPGAYQQTYQQQAYQQPAYQQQTFQQQAYQQGPAYQQQNYQQQTYQQVPQPGFQTAYQPAPMGLATQFSNLGVSNGGQQQMQRSQVVPQGMATTIHAPSAQIMNSARATVQTATSPTVKIRGLPYRSSPNDILAFFQGYHFLPDTLQIGLDSLGRPSGEAWLTFISPPEALRSVRDLNRHYLGNRYLELSIC